MRHPNRLLLPALLAVAALITGCQDVDGNFQSDEQQSSLNEAAADVLLECGETVTLAAHGRGDDYQYDTIGELKESCKEARAAVTDEDCPSAGLAVRATAQDLAVLDCQEDALRDVRCVDEEGRRTSACKPRTTLDNCEATDEYRSSAEIMHTCKELRYGDTVLYAAVCETSVTGFAEGNNQVSCVECEEAPEVRDAGARAVD